MAREVAGKLRILLGTVACLAVLMVVQRQSSFAAGTQSPRTEDQIETTIIHVDKYGVYAPNLIFYWDPTFSKQKLSTLTRMAERLRNKNAVITYATTSDITRDKRPLLVNLAPSQRESTPGSEAPAAKEFSRPLPASGEKASADQAKAPLKPEREEPVAPKPSKEDDASGPKPTSPEVPTLGRANVTRFIQNCLEALQSKDLERSVACYGDQVDYYTRGLVNKDFIRKDKGYYLRNWDRINASIDGEVVIIVIDQPDLRIAKFNSRFQVENTKNTVSGRAENIWKIQKVDNELKIVDEKQKIIERDGR